MADPTHLLRTARAAAEAAAAVHARWAGRIGVETAHTKGLGDFVSEADHEAQAAALEVIRAAHPDHRILAEEDEREDSREDSREDFRERSREGSPAASLGGSGAEVGAPDRAAARTPEGAGRPGGASGRETLEGEIPLWIVDPLDGTRNFLHAHPFHAASVAVGAGGRILAGAVTSSATGERWWASAGGGAWKDDAPIRVSSTPELASSMVGTGFPFKRPELLPGYLRQLDALLRRGAAVRRAGAASIDLCFLAEGRFDAFWELVLDPWDFAAGWLIVEEAGGQLTRRDGARLELRSGPVLGANSPELLAELISLLDAIEG